MNKLMEKQLVRNIKLNKHFTNPHIKDEFNWNLQDDLDGLVFELPINYGIFLKDYLLDKEDTFLDKKHYCWYIWDYFYDKEFSPAFNKNISKTIDAMWTIKHQSFYADYLKFIHKQHYFNTWSYLCFIRDEITKKPLPLDCLGELHFPLGSYDVFNIIEYSINAIARPDPSDEYTPWELVFFDLLETPKLNYLEAGLYDISLIFDEFSKEIGITDDNGNLTTTAKKIIKPTNIESITQGLLRTKAIKINPNGILPQIMGKLVEYLYLVQSDSYLQGFNGLALAYGMMQLTYYKRFSFINGNKIGESPTCYAACLLLILSRIFGVTSLNPTIEAILGLMDLDKYINGDDMKNYKKEVKKIKDKKPCNQHTN